MRFSQIVGENTTKFFTFTRNTSYALMVPHRCLFNNSVYCCLQPPINKWFKQYKTTYSIGYQSRLQEKPGWYIDVPDCDIALLFKITWW